MRRTKRLVTGVQVLLAFVYLATGLPLLAGAETAVERFKRYGLPGWFCYVAGFFETAGGAGLLIGLLRPVATVVAGLLLLPTMVVGAVLHRHHPDDHDALSIPPGVLAALLGTVMVHGVWERRRGDTEGVGRANRTSSRPSRRLPTRPIELSTC
jgi:uncharacterized membrane protein YphA (DoxX/SURF4 family)